MPFSTDAEDASAFSVGPSLTIRPQTLSISSSSYRTKKQHTLRTVTSAAEQTSTPVVVEDEYMKEYEEMKKSLLGNTRKIGGGLAGYLLLTVNSKAALCALLGAAASSLYLQWIYRDVDNVKITDVVPMRQAEMVDGKVLKFFAKILAAYRHALNPRLLVLVGLAAGCSLYGKFTGEPVPLLYEGCILGGFLSYKIALIIKLADDLSIKGYGEESFRPTIERLEDELDQYGRPKVRTPLPTAALPEDVDTTKMESELTARFGAFGDEEKQ